jgi:hypothetical protein
MQMQWEGHTTGNSYVLCMSVQCAHLHVPGAQGLLWHILSV